MDHLYNGEFRVLVRPPGEHKIRAVSFPIDRDIWSDYLRPLPRDREVPFLPQSREEADRLLRNRKDFTEDIGRRIAAHLLKLLRAEDTVNGYEREAVK